MSYTLRGLLAAEGNCGGTRKAADIRYLVIHYTGNNGDTAANNAAYYQNHVVEASAHYFVDDTTVCRSVPDLRIAWAVGGKKYASCGETGGGKLYGIVTNTNSISVELCGTGEGRCASEQTLQNAVVLCRELMKKYGIPLERVCRHFDVTGKLCPAYLVEEAAWMVFKKRLEAPDADNAPASYAAEAVRWAQEHGILQGDASGDLMLTQPCTRQQMAVFLHRLWRLLTEE